MDPKARVIPTTPQRPTVVGVGLDMHNGRRRSKDDSLWRELSEVGASVLMDTA